MTRRCFPVFCAQLKSESISLTDDLRVRIMTSRPTHKSTGLRRVLIPSFLAFMARTVGNKHSLL